MRRGGEGRGECCWHSRDPPESLSMPCLGPFHAFDILVDLKTLTENDSMHRFFIWTATEEKDCEYGRLKSKSGWHNLLSKMRHCRKFKPSDDSEHISYSCQRFLMERSQGTGGLRHIPFTWVSPKCGCSEIGFVTAFTFREQKNQLLPLPGWSF